MAKNSTVEIIRRLLALDKELSSVDGMSRVDFAARCGESEDTIKRDQEDLTALGHPSFDARKPGDRRKVRWHYQPGVKPLFLCNLETQEGIDSSGVRTVPRNELPLQDLAVVPYHWQDMLRVLETLDKAGRSLTRAELAKESKADHDNLSNVIGCHDPKIRAKNDSIRGKSLITRGWVRVERHETLNSGFVTEYGITPSGSRALDKGLRAQWESYMACHRADDWRKRHKPRK